VQTFTFFLFRGGGWFLLLFHHPVVETTSYSTVHAKAQAINKGIKIPSSMDQNFSEFPNISFIKKGQGNFYIQKT